jgi:hypothetical protein
MGDGLYHVRRRFGEQKRSGPQRPLTRDLQDSVEARDKSNVVPLFITFVFSGQDAGQGKLGPESRSAGASG